MDDNEIIGQPVGFEGIIPHIMKNGNTINYPFEQQNFQLGDFSELIRLHDRSTKFNQSL